MTTRPKISGSTVPHPSGIEWADEYAYGMGTLFDASALPLTAVGGTADAVTASLDPVLDAGLKDGMKFTLTWAAANTGGVTLQINGGAVVPVLDASGAALAAGALSSGLRSLIEYVGGDFRILSGATGTSGSSGTAHYVWRYTASTTWTKPSGLDPDAVVHVEMWGGGGSGRRSGSGTIGAGGGGSYLRASFRAGDLPASVAVVVGSGGAAVVGSNGNGNAGGASSFGALMTAFGGQGGLNSATPTEGGSLGSVDKAVAMNGVAEAGGDSSINAAAPAVERGGGGGAGTTTGATYAGGSSRFGGDGGQSGRAAAPPTAGSAPGGGGGGGYSVDSGAGARGEVRIWI